MIELPERSIALKVSIGSKAYFVSLLLTTYSLKFEKTHRRFNINARKMPYSHLYLMWRHIEQC